MHGSDGETFFLPDELARERLSIPAPLYNLCRLVLARCAHDHLFVPVRSMQMQSVIDRREVIFVDNFAYAVQHGQGGRLVMLAWAFRHDQRRDDLRLPAPIELVHYHASAPDLHSRLVGEFAKALQLFHQRAGQHAGAPRTRRVTPLRKAD